jgi:hypothetical protein
MANTWQIGFLAGAKPGVKKKRTQIQPIMFITFWFAGSWLESIPSENCKGLTR